MTGTVEVPPRRSWLTTVLVVAAGTAVIALLTLGAFALTRDEPQTFRYVIPAGAGMRSDLGQKVDVIPADLSVSVGDELIIVNEDDRMQLAGPFSIRPGETLRHTFTETGTLRGACTVNGDRELTIEVT